MARPDALISVVVPACNAAATLDRTLASILAQTHPNIEVIVVDDGSTDHTGVRAEAFARLEPRLRVVRQLNGGVASARNRGVSEAQGQLLAPIDADDLWHPQKLEKQLAVLEAGGEGMGFVYSAYRSIDGEDRVIASAPPLGADGWVLMRLIAHNFVGNGSSLLLRRSALEFAGGYDTGLREAGAQGCEDYLMQLKIAARYQVGVVSEYLVGHRVSTGSMSSNAATMLRSRLLAYEKFREWLGITPQDPLRAAQAFWEIRLGAHLLRRGAMGEGLQISGSGLARAWRSRWGDLAHLLPSWLLGLGPTESRVSGRANFAELSPGQEYAGQERSRLRKLMRRLEVEDRRQTAGGTYRFDGHASAGNTENA